MENASLRTQNGKSSKAVAGFERHRRSATSTNRRFYAVGAVIVIAAIAIVYVAMQGSSVYYVTLSEFMNKQAALSEGGKEVRVAGKVVTGTIARDGASQAVTFTARDKDNPAETMKVVYTKMPPDTFKDDADVVVTGTYANGVFTANEMLAKCPSKYSSTGSTN
ncbi:MAG TPA: cytochrome c maturation protein CcmE [Chloroflexia bacterium]|nr:cytochrome c maturation protein CcmE [Chloroflexia bacterium]